MDDESEFLAYSSNYNLTPSCSWLVREHSATAKMNARVFYRTALRKHDVTEDIGTIVYARNSYIVEDHDECAVISIRSVFRTVETGK